MPGSSPLSAAFRDMIDDVAYHGGNLVQGAFDLVCLLALGATVYAASLDKGAPAFAPGPDIQASASAPAAAVSQPSATCVALTEAAQPLDHGCITLQVLSASLGT